MPSDLATDLPAPPQPPASRSGSASPVERADDVVNIAAALSTMAQRQPDALALAYPLGSGRGGGTRYQEISYAELDAMSDAIARGLTELGIGKGVRTALMVKPSVPFFALTFGLFRAGAVPVMIDPGIGTRQLKICLGEAAPEAFIGIPAAHAARALLGWAKGSVQTLVTVGPRWFWGGHRLRDVQARGAALAAEASGPFVADTRRGELAAILFTSGSTGAPKGVCYTHGTFVSQVEQIRAMYDIQPGEIDLPTFPLFALFDPALGMTTIIPDMDARHPAKADPQKILSAIRQYGCTNMFGSPALLETLSRYAAPRGEQVPTIKRVISAGAPVPATVMRRMHKLLGDDAEIVTPYGATESLPVASIGSHEVLTETATQTDRGAGVCVGRPVPGIALSIIGIDDGPIAAWRDELLVPQGEIGEICVRGPQVTERYHGRDAATKLAKIPHPEGGVVHRMGDVGYLDERGRLWFCGRKKHRVETKYGTMFTVPTEAVFNTHPDVRRCALVGVGPEGAKKPVVIVEIEKLDHRGLPNERDENELASELRALAVQHDHTQNVVVFRFVPALPVDIRHNAKIRREELAVWASTRVA